MGLKVYLQAQAKMFVRRNLPKVREKVLRGIAMLVAEVKTDRILGEIVRFGVDGSNFPGNLHLPPQVFTEVKELRRRGFGFTRGFLNALSEDRDLQNVLLYGGSGGVYSLPLHFKVILTRNGFLPGFIEDLNNGLLSPVIKAPTPFVVVKRIFALKSEIRRSF